MCVIKYIKSLFTIFRKRRKKDWEELLKDHPRSYEVLLNKPKLRAFLEKNDALINWANEYESSSHCIYGPTIYEGINSFYWGGSKQGDFYWRELYLKAQDLELKLYNEY